MDGFMKSNTYDFERKDKLLRKWQDTIEQLRLELDEEHGRSQEIRLENKLLKNEIELLRSKTGEFELMLKLKDSEYTNTSYSSGRERGEDSGLYKSKNENLVVENSILKNRVDELERKVGDYKEKLLEMNEQHSHLRSEHSDVALRFENSLGELNSKADEVEFLQKCVQELETKLQKVYDDSTAKIARAESTMVNVEKDLAEEYNRKTIEFKTQLLETLDIIDLNKKENGALHEELLSTKNLTFKVQQEASRLKAEKDDLSEKERIIEWEKDNLMLEASTKEGMLRSQIEMLESRNSILEDQLDKLEGKLAQRKGTLQNSSQKYQEKEAQLHYEIENAEQIKEELKRKMNELVTVKEDHEKAMAIIRDYKVMVDEIEAKSEQDKIREKIDEDAYMLEIKNIEQAWQEVVRAKEDEIEGLKGDINRLRTTIGDLQRSLDTTNHEFSKLQDSNIAITTRAERLQGKYDQAKSELQEVNFKSTQELKSFKEEISKLYTSRRGVATGESNCECVWKECLKSELAYLERWAQTLNGKESCTRRKVLEHLRNIIQRMRDVLGS